MKKLTVQTQRRQSYEGCVPDMAAVVARPSSLGHPSRARLHQHCRADTWLAPPRQPPRVLPRWVLSVAAATQWWVATSCKMTQNTINAIDNDSNLNKHIIYVLCKTKLLKHISYEISLTCYLQKMKRIDQETRTLNLRTNILTYYNRRIWQPRPRKQQKINKLNMNKTEEDREHCHDDVENNSGEEEEETEEE